MEEDSKENLRQELTIMYGEESADIIMNEQKDSIEYCIKKYKSAMYCLDLFSMFYIITTEETPDEQYNTKKIFNKVRLSNGKYLCFNKQCITEYYFYSLRLRGIKMKNGRNF